MALSACGSAADPHGRELIAHGTTLFPVACYRDDLFLEDVPCPWHWHDELEAVTVSQGEVLVAAGGREIRSPCRRRIFHQRPSASQCLGARQSRLPPSLRGVPSPSGRR